MLVLLQTVVPGNVVGIVHCNTGCEPPTNRCFLLGITGRVNFMCLAHMRYGLRVIHVVTAEEILHYTGRRAGMYPQQ